MSSLFRRPKRPPPPKKKWERGREGEGDDVNDGLLLLRSLFPSLFSLSACRVFDDDDDGIVCVVLFFLPLEIFDISTFKSLRFQKKTFSKP